MRKGRMVTSRKMVLSLMWLFICIVLQSVPPAQGQTYTSKPQNTTVNMGKSATFTCSITPANATVNFTANLPQNTYALQCPGKNIKYPSMSMYGNCDVSSTQISASWQLSNIGSDINSSAFICSVAGLDVETGYLIITEGKPEDDVLGGVEEETIKD
ncbi:hypothetical protein AMELA_G00226900 [Ameiurus melas]|uniref:Ig-like domain-containing protein n=1 Tax=Ameiurus melas TaxID=219545 RepID=A0A7J6A2H1_AMEME|nr:hypothetical protein AMELA_G00226900 [Ameiurus melas]